MIYIVLITLFFVITHELARRHRTKHYLCRERLRDIWRWRLSPLPRRRAMVRQSIHLWWFKSHEMLKLETPTRRPAIEFASGLNHALAWAHSPSFRIRVSEPWLRQLSWSDVHETMGHEVAHLITDLHSPEPRPHGPAWKRTMKSFGLPPTVRFEGEPDSTPAPNGRPKTSPTARNPRPHAAGRSRRRTKP